MGYEKSNNELYAEKWFKANGFEIIKCKQYSSKTNYTIKKDNIEMKWELPFCVTDIKSYMNFCGNSFEMYKKLKAVV